MRSRAVFMLALFCAALAFDACAPSAKAAAAPAKSAAEADSLRTTFLLSWKLGDGAGSLDGALYTKKGFARMELYGPMGVPVASILRAGNRWSACVHAAKIFVEGEGTLIPDSLTAGFGPLLLDGLENEILFEAQPPGRVRHLRPDGWVQVNAQPSEIEPEWGSWVSKLDCPEEFEKKTVAPTALPPQTPSSAPTAGD